MIIKIIFISIFIVSLIYSIFRPSKSIFSKLFLISGSLLGILTVIGEKYVMQMANGLGVGRGADLIIYISLFVIFFFICYTLDRFNKIKKELSTLTRMIAIKEAKKDK